MKLIPLFILVLFLVITIPVQAIEINPSVETIPWTCRYDVVKWALCQNQIPGMRGINGTPGPQGLPNFSAIFYNVTNSTITQNSSVFVNVTNSTINSNYSVFEGTTFDSADYAKLSGRPGGQLFTGGLKIGRTDTTGGDLRWINFTDAGTGSIQAIIESGNYIFSTNITNSLTVPNKIFLQPYGGNVSVNTTAPTATFDVVGETRIRRPDNLASIAFLPIGSSAMQMFTSSSFIVGTSSSSTYIATQLNGGKFSIGVNPPTAQLDTTGSVRFRNCSGTPTFDTGGNLTCASDPKLKTAVTTYASDSAKVASIVPISYKWNTASGYDTVHTNTGFDAAQIQQVYPECIIARDDVIYSQVCDKEENCNTVEKKTGTQTLAIDDKCLLAVLWNSAKDQRTQITALAEENKKMNERITALEKRLEVKP